MGTSTAIKTSTGNYSNSNESSGPYIPPQNKDVAPGDGGRSIERVEDMLHKMLRRFDTSDEQTREMRGNLANISQKVDAFVVLIKYLE